MESFLKHSLDTAPEVHPGNMFDIGFLPYRGCQHCSPGGIKILSLREFLICLFSSDNLMDRMAAGLLCERAFGDPFALYETKGRFKIANTRDFAYMLIAPMIFYFTVWLMQEVRRWECDYILYPSRDAYLIEKLCSEILSQKRPAAIRSIRFSSSDKSLP